MFLETLWKGTVVLYDPSGGMSFFSQTAARHGRPLVRLERDVGQKQLMFMGLQGDEVYLKKPVHDESVLPLSLHRPGEETPRVASSASSDRSHHGTSSASDGGW